jgi:hypothetical protein
MKGKELGLGRRLRICDLFSITPHKPQGFPSLAVENEKEKPPNACHSIMTGSSLIARETFYYTRLKRLPCRSKELGNGGRILRSQPY